MVFSRFLLVYLTTCIFEIEARLRVRTQEKTSKLKKEPVFLVKAFGGVLTKLSLAKLISGELQYKSKLEAILDTELASKFQLKVFFK